MFVRKTTATVGCVLLVCFGLCRQTARGQTATAPTPKKSEAADKIYAIVVSRATHADAKWREVVEALSEKHNGVVIRFNSDVRESAMELSARQPDYVCFVATPEEITRPYVVNIHHMLRKLDDDPYEDALWAILTGYDAAGALRIAKHAEPLVLRRSVSGTSSSPIKPFESGLRFAEGTKGRMWVKPKGGEEKEAKCEPDGIRFMVDALNNTKPDCFFTSGHATTKDWQAGYRFNGGQFRCKDGQLYGLDTRGKKYDINSSNPKAYLAVGNCLIGLIPQRDCMALAWMNSGGAHQMFAHIATQWYGHMGWGMVRLLVDQPGRFNVTESFYFNQQSLLHRLKTEYPKVLNVIVEDFNVRRNPGLMSGLANRHGLTRKDKDGKRGVDRDALGLLWERDTTVLYGDPAWDARLARRTLPWSQKFTVKDGVYTFTVTTNRDGKWCGGRKHPVTALLPERVQNIEIIEGAELKPVVTDNFILIPLKGEFKKGQEVKVVFRAKPLARPDAGILAELKEVQQAAALLDESDRSGVIIALPKAGENRRQLIATIRSAPKEHRKAAAFLIANMPERDLKSLDKKFMLENIEYAFRARKNAPWSKDIPESLFYNHILPYAAANERRDNWRKDFYDRFSAMAWKCKSPGEAAKLLNKEVFRILDVKYHATKRPKPDQGPYESIKAKYASCTGLTVLLVDACRAVGIPGRLAGIPLWKDRKGNKHQAGNHSWTEIWDGQWYHLGSAEPNELNHAWFTKKCYTAADHRVWFHRIYAASFRKTGKSFPLVWDMSIQWIPATDVTLFYTNPCKVRVNLQGEGEKEVTAYLNGEVVAVGRGAGSAELSLAGGLTYDIVIRSADGKVIGRGKLPVAFRKPAPTTKPTPKSKPATETQAAVRRPVGRTQR